MQVTKAKLVWMRGWYELSKPITECDEEIIS